MNRRQTNQQQLRSKLAHPPQKRRKQLFLSLAAAGVAGTGSLAHADIATTLTGVPGSVDNNNIPVDHGSTAEATLAWSDTWNEYTNWDGRGDVYQLDQLTTNVSFAPTAANIKITVQDFFLDEWAGGDDTSALWSVTGSVSGLLASGNWTDFNNANDPADAGGRSLVTANATGVPGETLTLAFDHSAGGAISYLAMDNLTFLSVVVPEPATAAMAWLSVGGLGSMAMRRKRK